MTRPAVSVVVPPLAPLNCAGTAVTVDTAWIVNASCHRVEFPAASYTYTSTGPSRITVGNG